MSPLIGGGPHTPRGEPVNPVPPSDRRPAHPHPDTETFTARVGTWLWACAKAEAGETVETRVSVTVDGQAIWHAVRHPHDREHREGTWRVKPPDPSPPPTVEECLDELMQVYAREGEYAGRVARLLRRAGRLK